MDDWGLTIERIEMASREYGIWLVTFRATTPEIEPAVVGVPVKAETPEAAAFAARAKVATALKQLAAIAAKQAG